MKDNLCVIYNDGASDVNYSSEAGNFKRDNFTITMDTDDFIYIGYHKSINAVYMYMSQTNTLGGTLTAEYSNDQATWSPLEICDDTKNMSRSAFITWDRPSDAGEITVDGQAKCWVRLATDTLQSEVVVEALNLVFSDDNDVCEFEPALLDACFYQNGQTSHIFKHVAAKSYIMSRLRSLGYINQTADGKEEINEWDVLDIYQLKLASVYYTISQIYFNLSDDPEDQYWSKYKVYESRFEEAFALGRLDIDTNDNGQVDGSEARPVQSKRWIR